MAYPYIITFSLFKLYLIYSQGINTNTNKYFRELERPMPKHQPAQIPTCALEGKQKQGSHLPPRLQQQWNAAEKQYSFKDTIITLCGPTPDLYSNWIAFYSTG